MSSQRVEKCTSLIHGYTRQNQYLIQQIIPTIILKLLFDFYFIANPNEYVWQITGAVLKSVKESKPNQTFQSPVFSLFNLKFYINLWPNGDCQNPGNVLIFLELAALSPKVRMVQFRHTWKCQETDTIYSCNPVIATHDDMRGPSWRPGTLKPAEMQKHDVLTFTVDMQLYGVFDIDGEDITHKYIETDDTKYEPSSQQQQQQLNISKLDSIIMKIDALSARMNEMESKINDIHLRMNKEQKSNDNNRIDKLSLNNDINPEQQKLKTWLTDIVKLPEYYDVFINNGIDELSVVALIDKDALKDMGIDRIGHQIKILSKAKQLKQNSNNNNNNNSEHDEDQVTAPCI